MKNLSFQGNGWEYFKIWIVNIFLTVITLGIYYPWAKVRNLRYLYGNTSFEGRNFNYHATGKQLFKGYLIAMAIFIVYVVIQELFPIGGIVVTFLFFFGFPWIIWRSLKFHLRMTSYSNVRFGFDGELGAAYVNFLLLPILCLIAVYALPTVLVFAAIGLNISFGAGMFILSGFAFLAIAVLALYLFAVLKKRNTSYFVNGYRFGQGQFATTLETKEFVFIVLKAIGLSLLLSAGVLVLVSVFAAMTFGLGSIVSMQDDLSDPEAMAQMIGGGVMAMLVLPIYIGIIFANFLVIAYVYARQRAYVFLNSCLDDDISFESTLTTRIYALVMFTNFLAIAFSFGLAYPWAKIRMTRLLLENTKVGAELDVEQYVTQKQDEQSSLGEQLGDAFDVDVGIGI